jgi:hypothetical protein
MHHSLFGAANFCGEAQHSSWCIGGGGFLRVDNKHTCHLWMSPWTRLVAPPSALVLKCEVVHPMPCAVKVVSGIHRVVCVRVRLTELAPLASCCCNRGWRGAAQERLRAAAQTWLSQMIWLPLLPLRPEPALGDGLQPDTSVKEQQVTTFATEGSAAQQAAVADEVSGDVTAQITSSNSQLSAALYASHALSMWGQARSCDISLLVVLTHDSKRNRLLLLSSTKCSGSLPDLTRPT